MLNSLSRSSMTALRSTLQNRAIFSLSSGADRVLGPADQDVGLDADLPQARRRECCVGLVFSSPAALR